MLSITLGMVVHTINPRTQEVQAGLPGLREDCRSLWMRTTKLVTSYVIGLVYISAL